MRPRGAGFVAYDDLTGAASLSHGPGAFGRDCANYFFAKRAGVAACGLAHVAIRECPDSIPPIPDRSRADESSESESNHCDILLSD
jgi:hypothetical protein